MKVSTGRSQTFNSVTTNRLQALAGFGTRGLDETLILGAECCLLPYNVLEQSRSSVLKGFLLGPRAIPPLANVRVGVTIPTRAPKKFLESETANWTKHLSMLQFR
uniref:Uncharacterized protein n=1 Tax=Romanomermis culicivorax TaxID=13658 RepID=A0A915KL81_ROMCU